MVEAVTEARVITLVGPGGVGKTRVALRAAQQLSDSFPDGVSIAELSGLRDAELLPHTVASAVGLPELAAEQPMDQLIAYYADKRALLVLDTCEHLVDAVALFADILAHHSAQLVLLLTSRQPVVLPGEFVLPIQPLPEPGPQATERDNDAVALFVARAKAASPSFTLSEDNRPEVAALCRRVDCIPLALELAAVRLRTLPLEQVLSRLDDRFQLLSGARSAQARHHTLRATIEWSHDLCSPAEQELWAQLSVFAGGFTLAAVEDVCSGPGDDHPASSDDPAGSDVIDVLLGLVDKSVVQRVESVDEDRYRMLDTIREYGAERLAEQGGTEVCARRHRDFYLRMASQAGQEWLSDSQVPWGERLAADTDNFRVAMDFAASHPGDEAVLRLVNGLWGLWLGKSRLTEARRWTDRALAAEPEPTVEHGLALWFGAYFGLLQADPSARDLIVRCRAVAEQLDDDFLRARAAAVECFGVFLFESAKDGLPLYEPSLARLQATGDFFPVVAWRIQLSALYVVIGDPCAALREIERGLAELEHIPQERWVRNYLLVKQVLSLWASGDLDSSREVGQSVLPAILEQGETMAIAAVVEYLAWVACGKGEHELGALLLGGAGGLWRKVGRQLWGEARLTELHHQIEHDLMTGLGAERFTECYARGAGLSVEELVDAAGRCAPGGEASGKGGADDGSPLGPLTVREREVARLIAEGLSNRRIAERLVVSKRTADSHVEHIFTKLGFTSRNQVAAMITALKDDPRP